VPAWPQPRCGRGVLATVRSKGTVRLWGIAEAAARPVPRRSDAGKIRYTERDVTGLLLPAEHYAAPYDLRAPRGAALYRPFSGQGLEEMSLDLMADPRSER